MPCYKVHAGETGSPRQGLYRVYMGGLNTSYSFASVTRHLFMTSRASGDDHIVAMVEWIKSKLQ